MNKDKDNYFVKHESSQDDYVTKRNVVIAIIDNMKNDLAPYVKGSLKERMTNLYLEKLLESLNYYFNGQTQRISIYLNKQYKNSLKELFKYTRFLPENDNIEDVKQSIYGHIQAIDKAMQEQIVYIQSIEETRNEKKRTIPNVSNTY